MMNYRIRTNADYEQACQRAMEAPEAFWASVAENFFWRKKWDRVLDWNFAEPNVKWFINGKLNITENCLDRHLEKHGEQVALIWEPNEPGEAHRIFTYRQLHAEVCRFANVLRNLGAKKGDRVCIYMPMIPELAFAVLACARIGAVHSVVFAGFSAASLADRIDDAKAAFLITADGLFRGPKKLLLKPIADEAVSKTNTIQRVLVVRRTGDDVQMQSPRDCWYHEEALKVNEDCAAEEMDAEDMLFILYTSGSTGKPKGVVHSCGGYMVYTAYTFQNVFQYNAGDVYWCTADIGWITGHSYILYGPLLNGATTVMFEGIPTHPDAGRFWEVCEKHRVSIFYTAPTAIRSLMTFDTAFVSKYNLSSLRVLGSVGEPINEEAWRWYHRHVGQGRCAVADTWWQTETGGILISALAGISELKPSYAGLPLPGVQPVLLDAAGNLIEDNNREGLLCVRFPWPSMLRTTYGDHERCRQNYFAAFPGYYFTGDGARRDENGMYRIIGRVDDVINVSGHRIGTAEIENAINESDYAVESAVVGFPHAIKGQGIYAFIISEKTIDDEQAARLDVMNCVEKAIGKIARPDKIQFVSGLPKTRSGKIMRRILRKVAEGDITNLGDTSTLLDPAVVDEIVRGATKGM